MCLLALAGSLLGAGTACAQVSSKIDSLVQQLETAVDADRLGVLVELLDPLHRIASEARVRYGDEALALLDRFPNDAQRRHVLLQTGRAYESLRDTSRVRVFSNRLAAMGDDLAAGHAAYLRGRIGLRARDYTAAEQAFALAVEYYHTPDARRHQALTLYNLGHATRRHRRWEEAHHYYEQALFAYRAVDDVRGQGNALYWMGWLAIEAEAFAYAVERLEEALPFREIVGDTAALASVHYFLGMAHEQQGHYEQGFIHHTQALTLRESLGNSFTTASSLNAVADLHEDQGDFLEARRLYTRAKEIFRQIGRLDGVAATTNNIGTTHLAAEEWAEAEAAFLDYLALAEEIDDAVRMARAYQNLGVAYTGHGRTDEALAAFTEAQARFRDLRRREPLADTYRSTAELLLQTGALPEALAAADSSLVLAEALGALPIVREAQQVRGRILEALGRFEEALTAERAAEAAEDALFSPQSQEVIAEVQGAFQTREQRARIAALERQQQAQRRWLATLIGGVALLGIIVALLAGRYRSRRREMAALERARQAEAERAASLEAADAVKSQFLANISHELRTPLTLALGPVQDLLGGRFESVDEASPHFERAQRNGERLLRLINQLLEVAELDAGAVSLHLQQHEMVRFCREIVGLFDDFAKQRGITLSADLPAAPLLLVYDADHVEKVLANLLSNAIKFTPAGGTIGLRLTAAEDTVCLEVRDTGEGIAAEHLPRLFDRFYQAEQSNTRRHEGSGIGLALVKELVELHGGHVEAESVLGERTTIRVYLPTTLVPDDPRVTSEANPAMGSTLAEPAEAEPVDAPLPTKASGSEQPVVLLVEDNADMRVYIRSHLDDVYRVIEAADGQQGCDIAQSEVPDLVISDVMMPEMDGLTLTDTLKTDVRTSHIPVLLLTARAAVKDRIAGFEAGADAYLPKPFHTDELRVRVKALIDERTRLQARFSQRTHAPQRLTDTATEAALPAREVAFLDAVHQEVRQHMGNSTYTVEALAEALFMSRRQLHRKLTALTQETPSALLRRMRLERAAERLREGQSVKEVAVATGFSSAPGFSRAFTQAFGEPPSVYGAQGDTDTSDGQIVTN